MKRTAIVIGLLSSAGAVWASVTAPMLPLPRAAAVFVQRLSPVVPAAAPAANAVSDLEARIQIQALVLRQA